MRDDDIVQITYIKTGKNLLDFVKFRRNDIIKTNTINKFATYAC